MGLHYLPPIQRAWRGTTRIALCVFLVCALSAQVQQADEDYVKAAYLLNFARFVEWPDGAFPRPDDPIVICAAGADKVGEALAQMAVGKSASGRRVVARNVGPKGDHTSCHILFVGFNDGARIAEVLRNVRHASVLTVGEAAEFPSLGGMITLGRSGDTIQLQVRPEAAEAVGLRISSRLLVIAHLVGARSGGRK